MQIFLRDFMKFIGIIKEIDKLGRIVIPKELRERYGLTENVEIITTTSGLVLRNPKYELVEVEHKGTDKA